MAKGKCITRCCQNCGTEFESARDHRYCKGCNESPELLAQRVAAIESIVGGLRVIRDGQKVT